MTTIKQLNKQIDEMRGRLFVAKRQEYHAPLFVWSDLPGGLVQTVRTAEALGYRVEITHQDGKLTVHAVKWRPA